MNITVCFGRVVKEIRDVRQLSQEALAERASLNRTYLGEVERGLAVPSLITIVKISTALNVNASALIERSEALLQLQREKADLISVE